MIVSYGMIDFSYKRFKSKVSVNLDSTALMGVSQAFWSVLSDAEWGRGYGPRFLGEEPASYEAYEFSMNRLGC